MTNIEPMMIANLGQVIQSEFEEQIQGFGNEGFIGGLEVCDSSSC